MLQVKPPKVSLASLEPISLEDVRALIEACQHGTFAGQRDREVFPFLLDTGARARETCTVNLYDLHLNTGEVTIRYGKGGKSRTVFLGRITHRAMRAYLRDRNEHCQAVLVAKSGDYLTYDGPTRARSSPNSSPGTLPGSRSECRSATESAVGEMVMEEDSCVAQTMWTYFAT